MKWETILQEISKEFQVILKDNLVGIYLHGSVSVSYTHLTLPTILLV